MQHRLRSGGGQVDRGRRMGVHLFPNLDSQRSLGYLPITGVRLGIRSNANVWWRPGNRCEPRSYLPCPVRARVRTTCLCLNLGCRVHVPNRAIVEQPATHRSSYGLQAFTAVNCSGDEASLAECSLLSGAGTDCSPAKAVGISCLNAGGLPQDPSAVAEREYYNSKAKGNVEKWRSNSKARAQALLDEWFAGTETVGKAVSDCDILPGVPMPFTRALVDEAYAPSSALPSQWRC